MEGGRVCAARVCTVRSRADVKLAGVAEMAFQTAAADAEEHRPFSKLGSVYDKLVRYGMVR